MTRKLRRYNPFIGFNFEPKKRIFITKNRQRKVPVKKPRNRLIVIWVDTEGGNFFTYSLFAFQTFFPNFRIDS